TVLDLTGTPPRLLRPGLVTPGDIEAVVGPIVQSETPATSSARLPHRSPGQMPRHYAPRAQLELADDDGQRQVESLLASGQRIGWVTWPGGAEVPGALR